MLPLEPRWLVLQQQRAYLLQWLQNMEPACSVGSKVKGDESKLLHTWPCMGDSSLEIQHGGSSLPGGFGHPVAARRQEAGGCVVGDCPDSPETWQLLLTLSRSWEPTCLSLA